MTGTSAGRLIKRARGHDGAWRLRTRITSALSALAAFLLSFAVVDFNELALPDGQALYF